MVLARIADDAGIELDRIAGERLHVNDQVLGNTRAAQKGFGNVAFEFMNRVNADGGRAEVLRRFQPLRSSHSRGTKANLGGDLFLPIGVSLQRCPDHMRGSAEVCGLQATDCGGQVDQSALRGSFQ